MLNKIIATIVASLMLTSCSSDADIASHNLSKSADNFEVSRRVIFYNGINGEYILSIEGQCSLGNDDPQYRLSVTCKTSPTTYKKHFLGLSDNVTYFVEQLEPMETSTYQYKVIFKPSIILPDLNIRVPSNLHQLNTPKITR